MGRWYFILFFFLLQGKGMSQELLSVEFKESMTINDVQFLLTIFGINTRAVFGIDSYKITYTTIGSDMALDTASGLMSFPSEINGPLPVICYQHGTTGGRTEVPSNLDGGYQLGALFASLGMVVSAADFIGMGDSRGFHPYVHAPTEAQAGLDMLQAVLTYMEEQQIDRDDELFITGYSQGGHAAMALHKLLQEEYETEFPVTASLPMSGPYDISGVMRNLAFSDEEFFFPAYLVYSTLGAHQIQNDLYNDIGEIFRDEFLGPIRNFEQTGEGLFSMNLSLLGILENDFGASIPKFMYKDSILNLLETDENHPLNLYLKESDVYDWTPKVPVRMLYCMDDDQVPFRNSVVADSVMNARGAIDVMAIDVSGGLSFDHGACVRPALNEGIPWILSFLDATTPTRDILDDETDIVVFPNPASSHVRIRSDSEMEMIIIYSMEGKIVSNTVLQSKEIDYSLSGIPSGIYVLEILTSKGIQIHKLMIQD